MEHFTRYLSKQLSKIKIWKIRNYPLEMPHKNYAAFLLLAVLTTREGSCTCGKKLFVIPVVPGVQWSKRCTCSTTPRLLTRESRCRSPLIRSNSSSSLISIGFVVSMDSVSTARWRDVRVCVNNETFTFNLSFRFPKRPVACEENNFLAFELSYSILLK